MKILHCISDNKFFHGLIRMYDSFNGINNDYIVVNGDANSFKYLKSDRVITKDIKYITDSIINDNKYDIVILHNLGSLPLELIPRINPAIKVVWISWGFDIYEVTMPFNPLVRLKKQYKQDIVVNKLRKYKNQAKTLIKEITHGFSETKLFRRIIDRIDYFSGIIPVEYDLVSRNPYFRAKKIQFTYPSENSQLKPESISDISDIAKSDIMVGHQANILLNHKHTYSLLRNLSLPKDIRIISPLSYGHPTAINNAIKAGKKLLGQQFVAITDFMPYNDYLNIFKSVRSAIFNIERQCGIGNIILALWYGAKVFLPVNSMNYRHFISLGCVVFNIENELNYNEVTTTLSHEDIIKNREILIKHYSNSTIYNLNYNSLLRIISDISK